MAEQQDGDRDDKNTLVIEGPAFSMRLSGEGEFINSAYNALREDLMSRFAEVLAVQGNPHKAAPPTDVAPSAEGMTFKQVSPSAGYIWVCVCHDYYHKIHVLDRNEVANSSLAGFLDRRRLFRVFLERKHKDALESVIGTGRMLWSELTEEGQLRLGGPT